MQVAAKKISFSMGQQHQLSGICMTYLSLQNVPIPAATTYAGDLDRPDHNQSWLAVAARMQGSA